MLEKEEYRYDITIENINKTANFENEISPHRPKMING